jgi:hypothetical protein
MVSAAASAALSVQQRSLDQAALYIGKGMRRDKRSRVDVINHIFNFSNFQAGDHAIKNRLLEVPYSLTTYTTAAFVDCDPSV